MLNVDELIEDYRSEADIDFTGLWQIASNVQYKINTNSQELIRHCSLQIVRGLMARGVYPGDYGLVSLETAGFHFWPGEQDDHLKRIETEWIAMGKTPTLAEPICWFALRPTATVTTSA